MGSLESRASAIRGPGGQEDAGLENAVLVKEEKVQNCVRRKSTKAIGVEEETSIVLV